MYEQTGKNNAKKSLFMGLAAVAVAIAFIFLLTGCGSVEQSDVVGTWKCTFTEQEDPDFGSELVYVFEEDGSYSFNSSLDGEVVATDDGTYEIKDNKVLLHSSAEGDKELEVKGDSLVSADTGNEFVKAD